MTLARLARPFWFLTPSEEDAGGPFRFFVLVESPDTSAALFGGMLGVFEAFSGVAMLKCQVAQNIPPSPDGAKTAPLFRQPGPMALFTFDIISIESLIC